MNEFLTLLATKTAILTAFALLVGAATALVRRLDAKTTQLCWAFVLASGIVGGIAPFGPTLPGIDWPPTPAPTETVIETEIETPTQPAPPTFAEVEPRWEPRPEPAQVEFSQAVGEIPFETPEPEPFEIAAASPPEPRLEPEPTPPLETASQPLPNANDSAVSAVSGAQPFDVSRLVFALYWAGVFAALAFGTVAAIRLRFALRTAVPADAESTELLRREAFAIGVSRRRVERLRLLTTKRLGPALVVDGLFSASILVPEGFWNEASQVVKIGVLRHELAHWKRRDLVFSTAARAVRALHWFNPAAFWAVRRYDEAVEKRCDEAAFGGGDVGAARFVEAILATAESREIYSVLQKKFGGSAFLRRARNLQKLDERKNPMLKRTITLCVVAAFCVAILGWKIGGGNDKKPGASDSVAAAETASRPSENDAETTASPKRVDVPSTAPEAPREISASIQIVRSEPPVQSASTKKKRVVEISGTVFDADGKPAVGARVWGESIGPSSVGDRVPQTVESSAVETDANGKFALQVPRDRALELFAQSADGTQIGRPVAPLPPDALRLRAPIEREIRLEKGEVVSGTVVDAAGKPVEGATVEGLQGPTRQFGAVYWRLNGDSGGLHNAAKSVATSDKNGAFRLVFPFSDNRETLLGSERRIVAFKDGVGLGFVQKFRDPEDANGSNADFNAALRLTLRESAPLTVRVVDRLGAPIPEATVVAFPLSGDPAQDSPTLTNRGVNVAIDGFDGTGFATLSKITNADGNATFELVPKGENVGSVYVYGGRNASPNVRIDRERPTTQAISANDGGVLEVKVGSLRRIFGTVQNADGSPAANARVVATIAPSTTQVFNKRTPTSTEERKTNEKGEYEITVAVAPASVAAESENGVSLPVFDVKIDEETGDARVDLTLTDRIRVFGRARYGANSGMVRGDAPNFSVVALSDDGANPTPFVRDVEPKKGEFEFYVPAVPATYWIRFESLSSVEFETPKLEIRGDEKEVEANFETKRLDLPPDFPSPERDANGKITAVSREKFVGKVVDASGNPAANATVRLTSRYRFLKNPPTTRTDANGRFELPNFSRENLEKIANGLMGPAPLYLLATTADGSQCGETFVGAISRDVFVDAAAKTGAENGDATDETEIRTLPGRVFAGTVVDESGEPLEGASVWVGKPGEPIYVATTDASGKYRIPIDKRIPTWSLFAFKKGVGFVAFSGSVPETRRFGWEPDLTQPEPAADAPTRITLRRRVATVAFVDESGEPLAGLTVAPRFDAKDVARAAKTPIGWPGGFQFWGFLFDEFVQKTNDKGEITLEILPSEPTPDAEPSQTFLAKVNLDASLGNFAQNGGRSLDREQKIAISAAQIKPNPDGTGIAPIKIVVKRPAAVFGKVVNPDGTPAANVDVFYFIDNHTSPGVVQTNEKGEYEIVEPSTSRVGAVAAGGPNGAAATVSTKNVVDRPRRLRVDLKLTDGVKVFGTIKAPERDYVRFEETELDKFGHRKSHVIARRPAVYDKETGRYEIWLPKTPRTYQVGRYVSQKRQELRIDGSETEIEFNIGASETEND